MRQLLRHAASRATCSMLCNARYASGGVNLTLSRFGIFEGDGWVESGNLLRVFSFFPFLFSFWLCSRYVVVYYFRTTFKGCNYIYIFYENHQFYWFEFYCIHLRIIIVTEALFCRDKFPGLMILCTICVYLGINIFVTRVATNYVNFLWNFSTAGHVVPRCSPSPIISTRTFNREIRIKLRLFQRECFFFLTDQVRLSYGTNVVETSVTTLTRRIYLFDLFLTCLLDCRKTAITAA